MYMLHSKLPNQQLDLWWKDILLLTLALGGLFFILLGSRPLFTPDEGRYAEIAREMVLSGDYVTPHLNGIKYFEKPVLFYWLEAGMVQLTHLNLWGLRSVNAILGLLGCLLTYLTASRLYGRTTGILAALILGTSTLYFVMVHMISLDLPVTVFITTALYAFLQGIQHPAGRIRYYYLLGGSAAAACAVLTKGLIGLVFPAMIIFAWLAIMGEWRLLKQLYLPSCCLVFLLIAAPWHILAGQRNPEFYYFYFIKQHFLRYATLKIGHYQPVWFFIPNLVMGFFPWIVFLPQAIANALPPSLQQRKNYQAELFLLLWALLIFLFFSFSKSKLIPYILPVFPPLAILTARYLQQSLFNKPCLGIRVGYVCLLPATILVAATFFLYPRYANIPDPHTALFYLGMAAATLLCGTVMALFYAFRQPVFSLASVLISTFFFLLLSLAAVPAIDGRTISPLANIIKQVLTPDDKVVAYNQYYQDLPFYLEQNISVLNWQSELRFGMEHQEVHDWMINDNIFWQWWHSGKRVFALMGKDEFQVFTKRYSHKQYHIVAKTVQNILFSNKPLNKKTFHQSA